MALCVPIASAIYWNVSHRAGTSVDLMPALLLGAALSTLLMLPLSWPLQASLHDVGWLGALGVFQLAVPCALAVMAARVLPAPEASLLSLLEIVFAIAWVWLATDEKPTTAVVLGGALVLAALAFNQWLGMRKPRTASADRPGHAT
jgi:drug/metabolite transporter (DMT)-like permease